MIIMDKLVSNYPLPLRTPIHTLDDDALLNVFYIFGLDSVDRDDGRVFRANWDHARWWYRLVQVCRRWRHLIFAFPVRLDLHLLCTYGVPVSDMLAHSPPLPLFISYLDQNRERTAEDDHSILLALQHTHRIRRIGLELPASKLLKPLIAMDAQFPMLERLFIWSRSEDSPHLMLPKTLQAPHLRGFALSGVKFPIGSPLLTTTVGLVTLVLESIQPDVYFPPSFLIARLSSMTQLRTLSIGFSCPVATRVVEGQLSRTQVMARVTLPNLHALFFRGVSAYLDGLLARMNTPQLQIFHISFSNQLTFNVPHLMRVTTTTENLRLSTAHLLFYPGAVTLIDGPLPPAARDRLLFRAEIRCRHLDWQVASAVQVFRALAPILSTVETLTLYYYAEHHSPTELPDEVDPMQWRELLGFFRNVKTLAVADGLLGELSRSLQPGDEDPSLDLFPELRELRYSGNDNADDIFSPFIHARKNSGRPVGLVHYRELSH